MHPRASLWSVSVLFLVATSLWSGSVRADEEVMQGHDYDIKVTSTGAATPGQPTELSVVLTTYAGRKVNAEFPLSLAIVAPADVEVPRAKLVRADAREVSTHRAEFRFKVTPKGPGDKDLALTLRFATCTTEVCEPGKETIAFRLRVR